MEDPTGPRLNNRVVLHTTSGDITLRLFPHKAPVTVDNFLEYLDSGFYDGTIIHRVIRDFIIQGGGYTIDCVRKETRPPIVNEADNGLSNRRGTIAMGRTNAIDSATSQFFINVVDNLFLDHNDRDFGYAVFGEVVEGMDVVDQIRMVRTGAGCGSSGDNPLEPIVILSANRRHWWELSP